MGKAMKLQASRGTAEGSRLAHVIERLVEESPALARTRRARAADGDSMLVMLLREIDETVLPRRIVLVVDGREVAQMAVSNRRLSGLQIVGERKGTPGSEPGDPTSAARVYAHRLQALFDRPGRMRLRVDRKMPPADPDGLSCSARNLAACIGLSLTPSAGTGDLRDFLRGIETLMLAWMTVAGKTGEEHHRGPEALIAGLRAFREVEQKSSMASIRAARPRCLLLPLPDGRTVLRATVGSDQVLAVLTRDAAAPAMDAWRKVFGVAAG
ncbi:hypothetical protein GCM10017056_30520 [Seohaeicola zhoushanensis]|uniref:Uncharacterized protein n=2 Tax=Seohaeicola zhoushanensis TaxID=1569283 RepID=A0A8J3M831_9RHOB|nr:hypothetical protein GCM10017056_30520 [Seohaeicola zhoushanensis]